MVELATIVFAIVAVRVWKLVVRPRLQERRMKHSRDIPSGIGLCRKSVNFSPTYQ